MSTKALYCESPSQMGAIGLWLPFFDIMRRIPGLTTSLLLIAMLISACGDINPDSTRPTPYGTYEIDPIFRVFFKQNGGTNEFGQALTTLFTNSIGEKLQYVESGLLAYSPLENRFYFSPLGIELGLGEPPDGSLAQPGDLVINGYLIHPALIEHYLNLGRETIGAPISNPHYNYAKNRLEQHFENLGLYYLLDDPDRTPHLLSYGLLACPNCQADPSSPASLIQQPIADILFINYLNTRGISSELLGDVLKGPVLISDGSTEMVFEHMALSAKDGVITIQAIPKSLGFSKTQLFNELKSPILTFYPIQDGMGHNVLVLFQNFINANGGYGVCGIPTTEMFALDSETQVIRQCFTNLCLDYYPNALEAKVRPAQLGLEYIQQNRIKFPEDSLLNNLINSTKPRNTAPFSLHVWESSPAINSFTPQTISIMVFSHGVPQSNQHLELLLSLPNNIEQLHFLPPTNENGKTGITLQPISGENGDLVPYQVCLVIKGQESICDKQSFMIWGNP